MKKKTIIALVCINIGLLVALVIGTVVPRAEAQVFRGASDYLIINGQISSSTQAIYVLDLGRRRLEGWDWDQTRKRLRPLRGRNLRTDFRRESQEE